METIWQTACEAFDADYPDTCRQYWSDIAERSWKAQIESDPSIDAAALARFELLSTAILWAKAR